MNTRGQEEACPAGLCFRQQKGRSRDSGRQKPDLILLLFFPSDDELGFKTRSSSRV